MYGKNLTPIPPVAGYELQKQSIEWEIPGLVFLKSQGYTIDD
jgi:hypothetical protein